MKRAGGHRPSRPDAPRGCAARLAAAFAKTDPTHPNPAHPADASPACAGILAETATSDEKSRAGIYSQ
jgi:hypothetical protein